MNNRGMTQDETTITKNRSIDSLEDYVNITAQGNEIMDVELGKSGQSDSTAVDVRHEPVTDSSVVMQVAAATLHMRTSPSQQLASNPSLSEVSEVQRASLPEKKEKTSNCCWSSLSRCWAVLFKSQASSNARSITAVVEQDTTLDCKRN